MANSCTYHPTKPAWYHCDKCEANYCPDCITKRSRTVYGRSRNFYFCPKCKTPAETLSVGSFITPFWKRLPKFFAYPLQARPLILIITLSLIAAMLGRYSFVGSILLLVVQVKYSFAVLRNTVSGKLTAPELSYEVLGQEVGEVFKQLVLYLVVGIAVGTIFGTLGEVAGYLGSMLAILLLPAMIIILVTSESLINALNPAAFCALPFRIGWGYLLMYLFLTFLLGAPRFLALKFGDSLPEFLGIFLTNAARQYYTVIAYNLMGYVILQYHEKLGYEVNAEDLVEQAATFKTEAAVSKEQNSAEALMNQITILIKDGRTEDAIWLMQDKIQGREPDRILYERYYNLLKISQRAPDMLAHGKAYLDLLAAANERPTACGVYKECLSLDANFTPNPEALFKVAEWCTENDTRVGVNALVKFLRTNREHSLTPKAQFLLARNLNEKLNEPGKAQKILKSMVLKYPDHDLAVHAQRYLDRMNGGNARSN